MTMTDPIADMLTRIRNGIQVRRKVVDVPSSKVKGNVALVLKEEGYIWNYEVDTSGKFPELKVKVKFVVVLQRLKDLGDARKVDEGGGATKLDVHPVAATLNRDVEVQERVQ